LGLHRATVVGNSLGDLIALRLALSEPSRVGALILIDSAGLGRSATFALQSLSAPGYGELAVAWAKTPPGAAWRAWSKAQLLFAHPQRAPAAWTAQQCRLARSPGFLQAALAALRTQLDLHGQREVLLDRLAHLKMPTLIVWGAQDRVFSPSQAQNVVARLPEGSLALISDCGHMPHIERPDQFVTVLDEFLGTGSSP
jgi:2-hydroxy-6-oxonona-2,4-dienedioate hydrolase